MLLNRLIILTLFSFLLFLTPFHATASFFSYPSKPLLTNTPIKAFEIQGALAAKNKSKGWSANLNWVQSGPNSYQIRLMGPLGSGSILISRQGRIIRFQDGRQITQSTNADTLFLKKTGMRLPVNNLYYWVRGIPAPGPVQAKVYDELNHLQQLRQNGYQIDFTEYNQFQNRILPTRIRLQGNGLLVKVVIKSWKVIS